MAVYDCPVVARAWQVHCSNGGVNACAQCRHKRPCLRRLPTRTNPLMPVQTPYTGCGQVTTPGQRYCTGPSNGAKKQGAKTAGTRSNEGWHAEQVAANACSNPAGPSKPRAPMRSHLGVSGVHAAAFSTHLRLLDLGKIPSQPILTPAPPRSIYNPNPECPAHQIISLTLSTMDASAMVAALSLPSLSCMRDVGTLLLANRCGAAPTCLAMRAWHLVAA